MNDPYHISFLQKSLWRFKKPLIGDFMRQLSFSFWRRRQSFARARLFVSKHIFGVKETWQDRFKVAPSIFVEVVRRIAVSVVEALVIIVGLHLLSGYFGHSRLLAAFKISDNAAIDVVITLSSIAAILLGLYFAAVSAVISNSYARIPGDIRVLVAEEPVCRFYFRVLTLFAAAPMLLLGAAAYGITIDILNLAFICALGLFAVFSFTSLGIRTFDFFDPTSILPALTHKFAKPLAPRLLPATIGRIPLFRIINNGSPPNF